MRFIQRKCEVRALQISIYILDGTHKDEIDQEIQDIQDAILKTTIEGDLQDFLRIKIDLRKYRSIHLMQPQLIDQILEYLIMGKTFKAKSTPALSSQLLSRHTDIPDFVK